MRERNNYYDVAKEDIAMLDENKNSKRYNNIVALCQQACEKLLKSVAEYVVSEDTYCRHHKVHRIYQAISKEAVLEGISEDDLLFVSDFYIDARYPGDSFIVVDKKMTDRARACVRVVEQAVDKWRAEQGLPVYDVVDEEETDLANLAENI